MPGDCVLGIDCDKKASTSEKQRPPDTPTRDLPWTRCIHDFQAFIICLTRSTVCSRRYIINNKAIRARRGHDAIDYSRRYIITTRQ